MSRFWQYFIWIALGSHMVWYLSGFTYPYYWILLASLLGPVAVCLITSRSAGDVANCVCSSGREDTSVQGSAASALGWLGDRQAVEPLIAALKDEYWFVRSSAAHALGRLGHERAVEPLITTMKDDENALVRQSANGALERLRPQPATDLERAYRLVASQKWAEAVKLGPSAVEPLIAALKDTDHNVRRSAAEALAKLEWQPATDLQRAYYLVASQKWTEAVKLGPSAVEPLLVALKTGVGPEDVAVRRAAREALAKIGPLAVEPAIAALKDKDTRLHSSAAGALGTLGDKRAVEPLIAALKHEYSPVRSKSASALGSLGDPRAVEPLIAALKDNDASVRRSAASALGKLGDERAVRLLIAALKDQDRSVRYSAASALGSLGDERAVEPLIKALKDTDILIRSSSARALGNLSDKRAIEPLTEALKDENRMVQDSVGFALRCLADKGSAEWLLAQLNDNNTQVRASSAFGLSRLGDKRAVEPLIAALKTDESPDVRKSAASALGSLGDKRAVEPLVIALKDESPDVRKSAALALGRLGDKRAIEPLAAALQDKEVRSVAASLLACFGDSRAVKPLLEYSKEDMATMVVGGALTLINPPPVESLIELLKDRNPNVRRMAAFALSRVGDQQAVEPLIEAMKDEHTDWAQGAVAAALAELDNKRAVEPVASALKDKAFATPRLARLLGRSARPVGRAAKIPLIAALKRKERDEDVYVRSSAAWVLGHLGDKSAIEPLVVALNDIDGYVRWMAALALGRLGDKRAIEPLMAEFKLIASLDDKNDAVWRSAFGRVLPVSISEKLFAEPLPVGQSEYDSAAEAQLQLTHTELFPSESPALRRSDCARVLRRRTPKILDALVNIGPPAVEPLTAALKDKDEQMRQWAAEALRKLGRQPGTDIK